MTLPPKIWWNKNKTKQQKKLKDKKRLNEQFQFCPSHVLVRSSYGGCKWCNGSCQRMFARPKILTYLKKEQKIIRNKIYWRIGELGWNK